MASQIVMCGDAYKDSAQYIDDNTVIVTDPPYNIKYHYRTYNDNKKDEDYWKDLSELLSLAPCAVIMYPESLYILARYLDKVPVKVASWVYNANTEKQHRDCAYFDIKPNFNLYKQPYKDMNDPRVKKLFERTGGARSYDWKECPQVKNKNKDDGGIGITHPCQMPIEIMKWLVGIIPPEYKIFDPFSGSGTTGVACKLLDRDFIGLDVDEDYVRLANARIQKSQR